MSTLRRHLFIPALFFLGSPAFAQSAENPETVPPPPLPEFSFIQFVNASTPPSISLKLNGREMYPDFRPGEKTSPGALPVLEGIFEITDKGSGVSVSQKIKLTKDVSQTVVIVGDFKPLPDEESTGEDGKETKKDTKTRPNAALYVLDHALVAGETPLRYRLLNGMIGQKVQWTDNTGHKLTCEPGKSVAFAGKKEKELLTVEVGENKVPIRVNQDPPFRNLTFVVFIKNGTPTYATIPEDPRESH